MHSKKAESEMLRDLHKVIESTKIRLCLDCGKCTVVCPVSKYDPGFNPRLIVQRILRHKGRGVKDEKVWSCINCNMCMERCNYNVKFTDFIRAARTVAANEGAKVLCSHGGATQAIMHMMANTQLEQSRLAWLQDDIKVENNSDTVFFVGCAPYYDVVFSHLHVNTLDGTRGALRLLNRAKQPFSLMPGEKCCGRDLLLIGDMDGFMKLAEANMVEFVRRGTRNIITSCPECYYTLKVDYPHYLKGWDIEVKHVTEVLEPSMLFRPVVSNKKKGKVAYHDPCTLGRYSGIFEQPRQLISAEGSHTMVEMENNREKALCCGSNPWAHCGVVNKKIQIERLTQAVEAGADIMLTACPKCLIHLKCAQKDLVGKTTGQVQVRDMYEMLSEHLLQEGK